MNKSRNIFIAVLLMLVVAFPVSAQMGEMTGEMMKHGKPGMKHLGKMGHGMERSQSYKKGHRGGHGKGHFFGSSWKETLTDEQKAQADKMHLALKKSLSVPKAKLNAKKAELNNLLLTDNPDKKSIYQKIDEIIELKREIMRKKYDHKVEMRGMLTPEQQVSFDMKLLETSGHKKGHGRH